MGQGQKGGGGDTSMARQFFIAPTFETTRTLMKAGPTPLTVWMALALYANWKTGICWPSVDTLMLETRFSRKRVIEGINVLEELGLARRDKKRFGRTTIYSVRGYASFGASSSITEPQKSPRVTAVVPIGDYGSSAVGTLTTSNRTTSTNDRQSNERGATEAPTSAILSPAEKLYELWKKSSGSHIRPEKGIEKIDEALIRGASYEDIESAFLDRNGCRAKFIWEVLDPLEVKRERRQKGIAEVLAEQERKKPRPTGHVIDYKRAGGMGRLS
jgi:hypothetical protein